MAKGGEETDLVVGLLSRRTFQGKLDIVKVEELRSYQEEFLLPGHERYPLLSEESIFRIFGE